MGCNLRQVRIINNRATSCVLSVTDFGSGENIAEVSGYEAWPKCSPSFIQTPHYN